MMVAMKRLKGAIFSGRRAAYVALVIKAFTPFTRALDHLVFWLFGRKSSSELPVCILIVGPPRSGSTIVYQYLSRALPVIYLSNLHALMPYMGSRLMTYSKHHLPIGPSLKNYYGYTSALSDVYEGNEYWDKIFGMHSIEELEKKFEAFARKIGVAEKPFLMKNVRSFARIDKIAAAIPNMKFIRLKRSPDQVIQSELKAYYELGNFHPIPESMSSDDYHKDPLHFACRMILEIEKILDHHLAGLDPKRILEINYDHFCQDPNHYAQKVANDLLELSNTEWCVKQPSLSMKPSTSRKVSKEEEVRIQSFLKKTFNESN